MRVTIKRGWLEISEVGAEEEEREDPLPAPPPPEPAPVKKPYFSIGSAVGKAGETVSLSIEGGCRFPMNGFHIGGGVGLRPFIEKDGYGRFEATGVKLGPFLRAYLEDEGLIHNEPLHQHDHFWSVFQMAKWEPHNALPEEWWDYSIGFFSLDEKAQAPPTTIPSGTELFTLEVKILPSTAPGEYEVTCKDEWYYTQTHQMRRDFLYTTATGSGTTKLNLAGGKIVVVA